MAEVARLMPLGDCALKGVTNYNPCLTTRGLLMEATREISCGLGAKNVVTFTGYPVSKRTGTKRAKTSLPRTEHELMV